MQSDNISHIDIQDDHIDMVDYLLDYRIPKQYPISHIDIHIDMLLMSDLPYRTPISISISISDHILSLWPYDEATAVFTAAFANEGAKQTLVTNADAAARADITAGQGLTLVHFSAQLEPCLMHKNTLHTLNTPYQPLNTGHTTHTRTPYPIQSAQVELRGERV